MPFQADGRVWTPASVDPDRAFRPVASDATGILGRSTHGDLAVSADGVARRTLAAEGRAPGSRVPMEWDNLVAQGGHAQGGNAQGGNAQGGPTRKLLLAAPSQTRDGTVRLSATLVRRSGHPPDLPFRRPGEA